MPLPANDYTAYFQQLKTDKLPLAFKLEADRMENLVLTEKEFAKEIQVVMEERRMRTEDKPQALVHEQLNAAAFSAHPYHHPIIGWMNDLENMRVEDARAWYQRWYAPNNATLVVVGDVQPRGRVQTGTNPLRSAQGAPAADSGSRSRSRLQRGIKRVTGESAGQAALPCAGLPRARAS